MQIVLMNRGIFLINDFSCVQHNAAVNRAVADKLIERLFGFVLPVHFQAADFGSKFLRQFHDWTGASH